MITPTLQPKLVRRHEACLGIATALRKTAKKLPRRDGRELIALAARIQLCGSPANMFMAHDAINFTTGELFDAIGTYWNCGSKLCPNCISTFSRENRKKLREALSRQALEPRERYYFATYTIVNPGRSLAFTRTLVNEAWSRLRKRLLCVSLIRGGCKSEEFTVTPNGFHYHLHVLYQSLPFRYDELRRNWTECVAEVFKEHRVPLEIKTRDGLLWVKIIPVVKPDTLVNELCKYVTKSDSWSKIRSTDLAEIGLIRRWWRMFECFGSFAPAAASQRVREVLNAPRSSIVHTTPLNDGSAAHDYEFWRDKLASTTLETYLANLRAEVDATIHHRTESLRAKWPKAKLTTLAKLCPGLATNDTLYVSRN